MLDPIPLGLDKRQAQAFMGLTPPLSQVFLQEQVLEVRIYGHLPTP
jgi:hypothetical protein